MNIFDLSARIKLDSSEYESGLSKAKSAFSVAGKAIGTAVAVAGAAVAKLGKDAIESYANYEQLVGGVETLFKNSADVVQQYASNAYKTAGLSANQYMETVTSFSASLLQSLGGNTAEAAKVSDMAITDMADNANKMGTAMESIQVAYQGFAKQNYTMLDNLKLGYGGTKSEMERLLADAEKFSGVKYDIDNLNDVYQAIHVVQNELGITGTTAKEAASTISGSVNAMKGAWQNLITGIADDNANFDELINNFVGSVETAGNNIIPRVETTINGIGSLIEKLAPIIAEKIPVVVNNVLPNVLNAATTLITGFIGGLVTLLPAIVQSGGDVLMSLLQGILDNTPQIVDGVMAAIDAFIDFVTQNLPKIIQMGFEILAKLTYGIIKAIPNLVKKIPQIISAIINGLKAGISGIVEVGKNIVSGVWEGIKNMGAWLRDKVFGFFSNIVDGVKSVLGIHSPSRVFAGIGRYMAEGVGVGWEDEFGDIKKDIDNSLDFSGSASFGGVGNVGTGVYSSAGSSVSFGNITFNINGADYADVNELADAVSERLQTLADRRAAVWA